MSAPTWESWHSTAASREGWNIFNESEICRIDEPDMWHDGTGELVFVKLETDADAWRIVMEGTSQHHKAAQRFMAHHAPVEWERMQTWHLDRIAEQQPEPEPEPEERLHADVVLDPAQVDERLSVRIGNLFIEIGPRDVPGATVRVFDARIGKPEEIAVLQIEEPA